MEDTRRIVKEALSKKRIEKEKKKNIYHKKYLALMSIVFYLNLFSANCENKIVKSLVDTLLFFSHFE
jgi:hypothetical protein